MTVLQYALVIAVVTLMTAGQLLFRKSALSAPPLSTVAGIASLIGNPVFILALVLYAAATLLWVAVLQQVPLSRAYGFTALSFVIVPLAAIVLFGETVTPRMIAGMGLIIAGLFLIGARG